MINEMNRCLLGEGRIPIMSILESLLAVGYDRWIEIEIQGQDVAPLGYANVIDHALGYVERCREMAGQTSPASGPSDATPQKP
jgi:sugar phosphate isomerase/epimerase